MIPIPVVVCPRSGRSDGATGRCDRRCGAGLRRQACSARPSVYGSRILPNRAGEYPHPRLVLFSGFVQSACGMAQSAMGPFYCPGDSKVYIDLSFYQDMKNKLGAPGDFAQAYVIAHEVGHHVQNVLGIADKVTQARACRRRKRKPTRLSVRMELQADCFAGMWANKSTAGISKKAMSRKASMRRQPSAMIVCRSAHRAMSCRRSFTHGSSEQRVRWFKRGMQTGDMAVLRYFCDRSALSTKQDGRSWRPSLRF